MSSGTSDGMSDGAGPVHQASAVVIAVAGGGQRRLGINAQQIAHRFRGLAGQQREQGVLLGLCVLDERVFAG
jgi:hypothetical protein